MKYTLAASAAKAGPVGVFTSWRTVRHTPVVQLTESVAVDAAHAFAHTLQLLVSLVVSTQPALQRTCPAGHAHAAPVQAVQTPAWHVAPPAVHEPSATGSSSTTPLQSSSLPLQTSGFPVHEQTNVAPLGRHVQPGTTQSEFDWHDVLHACAPPPIETQTFPGQSPSELHVLPVPLVGVAPMQAPARHTSVALHPLPAQHCCPAAPHWFAPASLGVTHVPFEQMNAPRQTAPMQHGVLPTPQSAPPSAAASTPASPPLVDVPPEQAASAITTIAAAPAASLIDGPVRPFAITRGTHLPYRTWPPAGQRGQIDSTCAVDVGAAHGGRSAIMRLLLSLGSSLLLAAACASGLETPPPGPPLGRAVPSGDDTDAAAPAADPEPTPTLLDDAGASADAAETSVDASSDASADADAQPEAATGAACFVEAAMPTAPIADLQAAFDPNTPIQSALDVTMRRYLAGHYIVQQAVADNQTNDVDTTSFATVLAALGTVCHDETLVFDEENSTAQAREYLMGSVPATITPVQTFPRSEIRALLADDSTAAFDDSLATGDFADLGDDLVAQTNALGCLVNVAEFVTTPTPARDAAVAELYYLELYLQVARTQHADVYAQLKASVGWLEFVRLAWARARLWDAKAAGSAMLDVASTNIRVHVEEAANLDEIRQFTGDTATNVACHP